MSRIELSMLSVLPIMSCRSCAGAAGPDPKLITPESRVHKHHDGMLIDNSYGVATKLWASGGPMIFQKDEPAFADGTFRECAIAMQT